MKSKFIKGSLFHRPHNAQDYVVIDAIYNPFINTYFYDLENTKDRKDIVNFSEASVTSQFQYLGHRIMIQMPNPKLEDVFDKGYTLTLKECDHEWKRYHGFTDSFEYCSKCDAKYTSRTKELGITKGN